MVVMKPSGSSPGVLKALKKKPASKVSTPEHARQMKLGPNDSQDENDEENDTDPDVARDKGKCVKWAKMGASDKLPAYIVDMYEKEARTHSSPRKFRSKLSTSCSKSRLTVPTRSTFRIPCVMQLFIP